MAKKIKRPMTNVEFVTSMMEFSKYGPMAQIFIIDALAKQAELVSKTKPEQYDPNGFINGATWIGVAQEIKEKIQNRE